MNVTILGTGAFGIALSSMFIKNNCKITMWTKIEDEYVNLTKNRCNNKVLPNYYINKQIKFTMDMHEAIKDASIIVIAVPIQFLTSTILDVKKYYNRGQYLCIASKGILDDVQVFPYKVVKNILHTKNVSVISGPTFAIDMVSNAPMGIIVAGKSKKTNDIIKKSLENDTLTVGISYDIGGIELCGAIKNVMAIGCGIIDGMNFPESTKCMFFTKCFMEMIDLICSLGGNKKSAFTYAGIGDLLLTCNSYKSRNYSYGKMIGQKVDDNIIQDFVKMTTIEGRYTLKILYDVLIKENINSHIIKTLYSIIYEGNNPDLLVNYLKK